MNYSLIEVTDNENLWFNKDPVRPELNIAFRTASGRRVFGLMDADGSYKSFICIARTTAIPSDTKELDEFTSEFGGIVIPYSVWSYHKGAGREIINQVLDLARGDDSVLRVVTLSPLTDMAKRFHLRNSAFELRVNASTVNFEYIL